MIFAAERKNRVLLPMVAPERVGFILENVGVLRAVHNQKACFGILLGGAAGRLAAGLKRPGHEMFFHPVINIRSTVSAAQRAGNVPMWLDEERLAFDIHPGVGGQCR
jgi:hypothetical protein